MEAAGVMEEMEEGRREEGKEDKREKERNFCANTSKPPPFFFSFVLSSIFILLPLPEAAAEASPFISSSFLRFLLRLLPRCVCFSWLLVFLRLKCLRRSNEF